MGQERGLTAKQVSQAKRLPQPTVGTNERAFDVNGLKPSSPVFQRGPVGLGGFLIGAQGRLSSVSREKLKPPLQVPSIRCSPQIHMAYVVLPAMILEEC